MSEVITDIDNGRRPTGMIVGPGDLPPDEITVPDIRLSGIPLREQTATVQEELQIRAEEHRLPDRPTEGMLRRAQTEMRKRRLHPRIFRQHVSRSTS